MEKTIKHVTKKHYTKAFFQFIGEGKTAKFKQVYKDGPYLAMHEDEVFEILHAHDLANQVKAYFNSVDESYQLPELLISEVFKNKDFYTECFYSTIFASLDAKSLQTFRDMLSILAVTPHLDFWLLAYEMGNLSAENFYAKLVFTLRTHQDLDEIIDDLIELYVVYGEQYLNELTNGTFKTIDICEHEDLTDDYIFHIFNVDKTSFDD